MATFISWNFGCKFGCCDIDNLKTKYYSLTNIRLIWYDDVGYFDCVDSNVEWLS